MATKKTNNNCFIIMPITTPDEFIEQYKGDRDHFKHVLENLFIPAVKDAGFEPISPIAKGSNLIQADMIQELSSCELVLCDMSILNPNVFFEFGIRTAIDKPVALVIDKKTKTIPFDTSIINFYKYDDSLDVWNVEEEKKVLTKHIKDAYKKSENRNALWKYFGVAQKGTFKPEEAELGDKIDLLINRINAFEVRDMELEKQSLMREYTQHSKSAPVWSLYRPELLSKEPTAATELAEELIELKKEIRNAAEQINKLIADKDKSD